MLIDGISKWFYGQWRRVDRTFKVGILTDIRDLRFMLVQRIEGNTRNENLPLPTRGRGKRRCRG